MTTSKEIDDWRNAKSETEHLEFKEAKQQYSFDKLLDYCVAMANEGGGVLLLGIANKPPRPVVGSNAFLDVPKTATDLLQKLQFRVDVEEVQHPDGRVVVFRIPPRPLGHPHHIDGTFLMRSGESTVGMTQDRLKQIFAEVKLQNKYPGKFIAALSLLALALLAIAWWRYQRPLNTYKIRDAETTKKQPATSEKPVSPSTSDKLNAIAPTPSPKVHQPAITVAPHDSSLPLIHRTDTFTTFVILNSSNRGSPIVPSTDLLKATIYSEFQSILNQNIPESETDWPKYLGIALQHFLIVLINYGESGYVLHSESNGIILKNIPPIDIPDEETYSLASWIPKSNADPLLAGILSTVHQIKFPKATKASLSIAPASSSGPETYSLRFERNGYYRLDLRVNFLMRGGPGQLPQKFKTLYYDTSQATTYYYSVKYDLAAKRNNDNAFASDDYIRWSDDLFQSIKGKLEQPAELPQLTFDRQDKGTFPLVWETYHGKAELGICDQSKYRRVPPLSPGKTKNSATTVIDPWYIIMCS